MCGRYTLFKEIDEIDAFLNSISRIESYKSYNINPWGEAPVVIRDKEGQNTLGNLHWNLNAWPYNPKAKRYKNSNATKEFLLESKVWSRSFPSKRCLVPMNGFYEWTGPKSNRIPHYIYPTQQPLLVAAGLWSRHSPKDGVGSFTIITVPANEFMEPIHDRMPAFLLPEEFDDWLNPDHSTEYLLDMLDPFPDDTLAEHLTSKDVNTTYRDRKVDEPYLIEPV